MARTSAKQHLIRNTGATLTKAFVLRRQVREWLDNCDELEDDVDSGTDTGRSRCSSVDSFLSFDALSSTDSASTGVSDGSIGSASSDIDMSSSESSGSSFAASDSSSIRDIGTIRSILATMQQTRVLLDRRAPRDTPRLIDRLDRLTDTHRETDISFFRHLVRMLPEAFDAIASLIATHEAFLVKPRHPGAPVREQLAVALYWLGRSGNGASAATVAFACGCSEESVIAYTGRVVDALFDHRRRILCWASQREKEDAQAWVAQRAKCTEFGNGWSMVDGSLIPLAFKPGGNAFHREYFDRKGQYSLNLQLVVLPTTLRIIDFVAGYKGSTQDSRAFAASDIVKRPRRYMDEGEFVWTDSGYGLSEFTCGPYDHVVAAKSGDFRRFNYAVSNVRVRSEHAFGYLKGRFQSMTGIRVPIKDEQEHHRAVKIVVAALVAHNIALRWDGQEERECFIDLSDVSAPARDAWHQMQVPSRVEEEKEVEAWKRRMQAQRRYDAAERARRAQLSQYRLDLDRRDRAKELRESLHTALFDAHRRVFADTTPESRKENKTEAEYQEMLRRRAAQKQARRQARGSQRGRGRGRGAGRRRGSSRGAGRGGGRGAGRGEGRGVEGGRGLEDGEHTNDPATEDRGEGPSNVPM
ncbi:hypothetical protein CF328_g7798 [Tilletia controversa]|nr:hypothetical protein CF328_g7798 [Tilletia controversa]